MYFFIVKKILRVFIGSLTHYLFEYNKKAPDCLNEDTFKFYRCVNPAYIKMIKSEPITRPLLIKNVIKIKYYLTSIIDQADPPVWSAVKSTETNKYSFVPVLA